jgi:hypothetical protein
MQAARASVRRFRHNRRAFAIQWGVAPLSIPALVTGEFVSASNGVEAASFNCAAGELVSKPLFAFIKHLPQQP